MLSVADPIPPDLETALQGRYRIERLLGRGGMATVYLAHDLKHDRPVALKLLTREVAELIGTERFQREIRLAARLQHPHICSVYDSGDAGGLLWFTMPFIEGESLDARLERGGPLPVDEALRIAREAAQALAYAHDQGVVHRDIKPANLLLARDGSTLVADFGIARAIGAARMAADETLTQPGFAPGTPAYMSPEQAAGSHHVDGRTDIYSLGLVLYEMLAGERPFQLGPLAGFEQLMTDPVPRVRARRAEVPAGVDELLQRALAFDPVQRLGSMAAFGAELEALRLGRHATPAGPGLLRRVTDFVAELLSGGGAERRAANPEPPPDTVAVLPFRDLSPARDQAYFSDGLAEELTDALSRVPGLRVAARSGAFRYRGAQVDAREAGQTLGVGAVVSGSVRRQGDRLRVGAQLVGVRDGYELWSHSYDGEMADVFQVQAEIARAIAAALRVTLLGADEAALSKRPTADLEAYDLYLKGRFAWHQRTGASLVEAARYFEEAATRDPSFARAWAGLADAGTLLPLYAGTSPASAWPKAKAAAARAIGLDDRLAEAHTSLAYGTMLFEWDWAAAERSFQRAIAADPAYPIAHHWYADFLAGRGRFEESLVSMQRARELDPLSRITMVELGWVLYLLRRAGESDAILAQVLRLDPTYPHAYLALGLLRLSERRAAEAVLALRRSVELGGFNPHTAGALIAALAAAGDSEGARAELAAIEARAATEYVPPFAFVAAYAGLGNLDGAFRALDQGIAERDVLLPENFFEPLLDPLVPDARYAKAAALMRGSA